MKIQQFIVLLVVASLAIVAIGASAQCGHCDDGAECVQCCNANNYMYGDFNRYGCTCDMYGKRESEWLFDGTDYE